MLQKDTFIIKGSNDKPIVLDLHYDDAVIVTDMVVYAHGFNGFKDWGNGDLMAQYFTTKGFIFAKFNFSHNGTSPDALEEFVDLEAFGQNNFSKQLFDLDQVFIFLQEKCSYTKSAPLRYHLIGHSMGGGVCILYAHHFPEKVHRLITWAAIGAGKTPWGKWTKERMQTWQSEGVAYYFNARTNQQLPLYYQLYEDYVVHQSYLDISHAAAHITQPWLIAHGTADEAVSVTIAEDFHQHNPEHTTLYLPHTNHTFGRIHPHTNHQYDAAFQGLLEKTIAFIQA